jgi:AraC-like DNA-binding protein
LERVRERLGEHFTEHDLNVADDKAPIETFMRTAPLGDLAISSVQFNAPVDIRQTVPEDILIIGRPLRGELEVQNGDDFISGGPPKGAILSMDRPNRITTRSNDVLFRVVRTERAALERPLAQWLDRELPEPLRFEFSLHADREPGRSWWGLVEHLWSVAENGMLFRSPILIDEVERVSKTLLLTLQPHNYSEALSQGESPAAPYYVRRAEEYIYARAGQVITMENLVEASGVSARSLYEGFRRFRGTTPMAFIKWLRLDRAHCDLLAGRPGSTTVAAVAAKYGFTHLGHFAAAHRRKYGETPSEVLRRPGKD